MSKGKRITIIIFSAIAALALFGYLGVNPLLSHLLKQQVEEKLIGNFTYEYDTIQVDVFKRSVTMKNVRWQFPKDSSKVKHRGTVNEFSVDGISILALSGHLHINAITIDKPHFNTQISINKLFNKKNEAKRLDQFNFYSLIESNLNSLEIDEIKVQSAEAKWFSPDFKEIWRQVEGGFLKVESLRIDSAVTAKNNGLFGLENFDLQFEKGLIFLPDSLHKMRLGKTKINFETESINIDSVRVKPIIKDKALAKAFELEKTSLDLLIPHVDFNGIQLQQLFEEQILDIQHISLNELRLEAFKDKEAIEPTAFKPLPQDFLKNLSRNINIDTIDIINASVVYEQRDKGSDEVGKVNFEEINGKITNVTNDSVRLLKNGHAIFEFSTKLFDAGHLSAKVNFDLQSANMDHSISGHLQAISLTEANQIITPLQGYHIKSGEVDDLYFNFHLNKQKASGDLRFLYKDLKIQKLDDRSLESENLKNKLISFVANAFVVRKANPNWRGQEKAGKIDFERVEHKSIFHYWWYSILSGLQSILME